MYGIIDFSRIDTEPGAPSAFAPPSGWHGDYMQYMRQRWKTDPGVRQHVAVVGRMLVRGERVVFCGPFAKEAKEIAEAVWR
ncbi:MAG: hypothetical protein DI596_14310 [Azospira oryzae]|uniref:Uncharacterized protein n=1 Tax=Pelomicrobium methylotrophicum TaxID=2602750 RepID=A0A5C7EVR4_9PROT|nr:hypothetical protein [Pelomicrobium methylotrophicum]PZP51875.1 MAG: hypothetical protein DI596_14310 [Azospira oryzae]PZP76162.1 MAG: hypothetical protein DI593_14310 [Azospira oryzae]TXF11155.1 hypothetical protein FR698_11610 [Pelomicrobium methylotrophicum]